MEIRSYQVEKHHHLLDTTFGRHPGRSTTDTLHLTVKFIFDQWRKGNIVSALFLDVKGAFLEVQWLIHNIQMKGVPQQYTNWILNRLQGQQTKIQFNNYISDPLDIDNRCDQGDPTTVILHHFYNAGLINVDKENQAELTPAFIDDITFQAVGTNFTITHAKICYYIMIIIPKYTKKHHKIHNITTDSVNLPMSDYHIHMTSPHVIHNNPNTSKCI